MPDKAHIYRAALKLFYKKGIQNLSNEEIISALGLTPNNYYSYFRDTADLLERATLYSMEREKKIHKKIITSSENAIEELMGLLRYGADAIAEINPQYIDDLMRHHPRIIQLGRNQADDYTIPLYSGIINRGIQQGLFRQDINVQIVTRFIMESAYIMINYRVFPPEKYSPGEVLRNIYLYYFRGICVVNAMPLVDEYFSKPKVEFDLDDDI